MAAKSTSFANLGLRHVLLNEAIANIGDASGIQPSATAGSLYVALHSSDPGVGGSQNTNEISYTGYARVAVARTSGGWTVTGATGTNAADITWPNCTAGSATATYISIGTLSSGAGLILWSGALASSLSISTTVTPPRVDAGSLTITES